MNRVISTILAVVLTVAVVSSLGCAPEDAAGPVFQQGRKWVIIVTFDTTRSDHLGCYGNPVVKTPNIDSVAGDGCLFEKCYSVTNVTLPSHVSLFTSYYMKDHAVVSNKNKVPDFPEYMSRVFAGAGYTTAAFTSAGVLEPNRNAGQGFGVYENTTSFERKGNETTDSAIGWLKGHLDDDVFVWVHYYDPHFVYIPPPPFNTMYNFTSSQRFADLNVQDNEMLMKNAEYMSQSDDPEHFRNLYKGEVSFMDNELGRLVGFLKECGAYDPSLIVLTADHGESLGEEGMYFTHESLNDANIKIPLIIKPGGNVAGQRRKQAVSLIDVYPTVLGLSGLKWQGEIRGKDLGGIMEDPDAPAPREVTYYQEVRNTSVGMKRGGYTYIRRVFDKRSGEHRHNIFMDDKSGRLYDSGSDPEMLNDISADHPELADEFRSLATEFLADTYGTPEQDVVRDEESIRKLKTLGYIH